MEKENDIFDYLKPSERFTPDQAYFDQLAEEVIKSQKVKVIPLYKKPIFWISSAAAVIAVMLIFNFEQVPGESDNVLLALNDISQEEVLSYVHENIEEFDTHILTESIPSNNIEEVKLVPIVTETPKEILPDPELNFDDIDQEDILNYLRDEEVDLYDFDDTEELFN